MTHTIEQKIKFDSGLTIGVHLVLFKQGDKTRKALVEITPRGIVNALVEPTDGNMYAAWDRIKGDAWVSRPGTVCVWPKKNAEFMARFEGETVVTICI